MEHQHTAKTVTGPLPFFGPVNPRKPNRSAHGGVRYRETCQCGAYRDVLQNGAHGEVGEWRTSVEGVDVHRS